MDNVTANAKTANGFKSRLQKERVKKMGLFSSLPWVWGSPWEWVWGYGDRNSVPTAALSVLRLVFDGPTGRHGDLERSSSKYPVSINEEIANFSALSISGSGERERASKRSYYYRCKKKFCRQR